MNKIIITAVAMLSAVPALADEYLSNIGSCTIYAENSDFRMSSNFLAINFGVLGLSENQKIPYIYGPLCGLNPGGRFVVRKHSESDPNDSSPFGRSRRDGADSTKLFATSDGCEFEVEYWLSGGQFRNEITFSRGCMDRRNSSSWEIKSQQASDGGYTYFIGCGNGSSISLEYRRDLEPQAYFAGLGHTFSTLDRAVQYKCGQ